MSDRKGLDGVDGLVEGSHASHFHILPTAVFEQNSGQFCFLCGGRSNPV